MSTGAIGCTFASLFAKHPETVGWLTIVNPDKLVIPKEAIILSLQFPGKNKDEVKAWALNNGFYLEDIGEGNTGLRYKIKQDVAWVQYFGLDSHVTTRKAPIPELMLCVKRPIGSYFKVGYNNILHLAHATVRQLSKNKADKLWETSYKNTAKRLGHSPTLSEASKTTYYG
ncbi:MAG: Phi17:2 [Segetibacter sp.]|nr:Phi17:2 [Segetibacter sp.]